VLHRSGATDAADLIFMPFGAPQGHTKTLPADAALRCLAEFASGIKNAEEPIFAPPLTAAGFRIRPS
jgi:hypothetical protein